MKHMTLSRWMVSLVMMSVAFFPACTGERASLNEAEPDSPSKTSFLASIRDAVLGESLELPAGTEVPVRLDHSIGSAVNSSGDTFQATLDRDLTVDGRILAPKGSLATGLLTDVEGSKRVKGRASLTMTLTALTVNGREYSLETRPIVVQAEGTKKKDAAIIGGSSAVGAVVGALAGGGKGAAVGAGIGAGGGTGLVLATKGEEVEFSAETRFKFVLSEPLELPVVEEGSIT